MSLFDDAQRLLEDDVLISCWSVKGGSGTTVCTAALALMTATSCPSGVLTVDLSQGDLSPVLGVEDPSRPGVGDWLNDADADDDALRRIEVPIRAGVHLLPAGRTLRSGSQMPSSDRSPSSGPADRLVEVLLRDARTIVADCGLADTEVARGIRDAAAVSLLVVRPCYLALRRVLEEPIRPTGIVLVREPGRSIDRHEVESVLGVPVRAVIDCDPGIARKVDSGLLAQRLPRGLFRELRHAA